MVEGSNELGATPFMVRAHGDFGVLWYALGYDDRAADSFRRAARLADKLAARDAAQVHALAAGDPAGGLDADEQRRSHGRDREAVASLVSVSDLLHSASQHCTAALLEAAEQLRRTWRARVTARADLLHLLATTWPPPPPSRVAGALAELQLPEDDSELADSGSPFQKSYLQLDGKWLAGGGTVRVAYAIVAGLTSLLASCALVGADAAQARALAERAVKLGCAHLADASPTQQGIFEYHCAAFLLLKGDPTAASRYITTAVVNHGGCSSTHDDSSDATPRNTRLRLQALLLSDAPPAPWKAEEELLGRRGRAIGADEHARAATNPDHPVLLRLELEHQRRLAGCRGRAGTHSDSDSALDGDAPAAAAPETAPQAAALHNVADVMAGLARVLTELEGLRK